VQACGATRSLYVAERGCASVARMKNLATRAFDRSCYLTNAKNSARAATMLEPLISNAVRSFPLMLRKIA
jgi:hypothetical protein